MSDFFSRLAERALGQAETAQPVLAPRFAVPALVEVEAGAPQPESATWPQKRREAFEPDPVSIAPEVPPEIPAPVHTRPLSTQEPEQKFTSAPERSQPEVHSLPAAPPEPAGRPLANARGSETVVLSRDREVAVFIESVASPEPDVPEPVNVVQPPPHPPKAPARALVHPPAVPQVSPPPRAAIRVEPSAPPRPTEIAGAPPPPPPQQPVPIHVPPPVERPQAHPEVEMAAPAARDVNVHIGRIEIRAAAPPAPPAPRPRTTLSLAEYLKMRNGDRR